MTSFALPAGGPYELRNARIPAALCSGIQLRDICPSSGLGTADLVIADGRFGAEGKVSIEGHVDLGGGLVLPGFVDMHVHLDKAHTVNRTGMPKGGLEEAVRLSIADAPYRTAEDLRRRMEYSLRCAYAHGTAAMRTHLDSPDRPAVSVAWRIFKEVKAAWRGRIDLQGVALMSIERADDDDFVERCAEVAEAKGIAGAFIAGGAATAGRLDRFLGAACEHGLDVDFHVDETLDPGSNGLKAIAEAVLRTGYRGQVVAGHCCSLSAQNPQEAEAVLGLVAQAGLHIVSLPLTNMFLMDRKAETTPRRRGVTLVHEMQARGIPVSFASDNVCDPFFPHGDFDMLEVLRSAVRTTHLEDSVGEWIASAFERPADAMGMAARGRIAPGLPADAVLFRARDWIELFSRPHSDRQVIRDGSLLHLDVPDFSETAKAREAA